jgi:hypothetical protein
MGRRVLLLVALALVPAGAASAAAPCPVKRLPAEVLREGDAAVERYRERRALQFTPDLMGYRDGPALGPPSRRERRRIRRAIEFRRDFRLNTSRLLVRRLLRDRTPAVRRTVGDWGLPLTPLEVRELGFRRMVQDTNGPVQSYAGRCARRVSGGTYLDQDAPNGIEVVLSVVSGKERHLEALRPRYRLRGLLRVRRVRFTERHLRSVSDEIAEDFGEIDSLYSTSLSIRHNRVLVGLRNPGPGDQRLLRRRYGPALRFWTVP